jgi:UDP-2-acetamido-3-amino-2,3-dideoxy-glucuronate N-acetyltransferase
MGFWAHESAYIDEGVHIGEGTKIWHFSHVMSGAKIGRECTLGQNVFVGRDVQVGDHVKIQNNVSVFEGVVLEDYVFCGPGMSFTNVKTPRSAFPRDAAADYLTTRVQRGASLGANATIVCGTTIGPWAFVAAGAVVVRDVPSYRLIGGVPGREMGWACQCGVPLVFHQQEAICAACQRSYRQFGPSEIRLND